jgi:hypothetical protein
MRFGFCTPICSAVSALRRLRSRFCTPKCEFVANRADQNSALHQHFWHQATPPYWVRERSCPQLCGLNNVRNRECCEISSKHPNNTSRKSPNRIIRGSAVNDSVGDPSSHRLAPLRSPDVHRLTLTRSGAGVTHLSLLPAVALGLAGSEMSAIGSVLGGVSNPIVVGLVAGILVTVAFWQIGSAGARRPLRASSPRPS